MKKSNKILLFLGLGTGLLIYFSIFYNYTAIAWTHKCDQIKWHITSEKHLILVANSLELKEDVFKDDNHLDFLAINKTTGNLDHYIRNVGDVPAPTRAPNSGIKTQSWTDTDNPYILYYRTDETLKKVNLLTEQNDWELNIPIEISMRFSLTGMKLLGRKNGFLYFIMLLDEGGYYEFIKRITDEYYYNPKVLDKYKIFQKYQIEGSLDHLIIEINETTNEIKLLKSLPKGELEYKDNFVNITEQPLKSPMNTTILLQEGLELQIIGDNLCAKYK